MLKPRYVFDEAELVLRSGGVVIVPTETFYALAADPFREAAVQNIFHIKGRLERKPLPLIAADLAAVKKHVVLDKGFAEALMERFWPGSLTLLLEPSGSFSQFLTGPQGKIGVRVPPWCPARILAARAGGLITATSANLSGHPEAAEVAEIAPEVLEAVDMVMDLGPAPSGRPSTVVEAVKGGFRVLREGAIPESAIREAYEQFRRRNRVDIPLDQR
jgi:L-threonylcarbamoyladenylate synthase